MVEICCENNMIFIDVATILKIFHETTYIQFNHFTCTIHAFTYMPSLANHFSREFVLNDFHHTILV